MQFASGMVGASPVLLWVDGSGRYRDVTARLGTASMKAALADERLTRFRTADAQGCAVVADERLVFRPLVDDPRRVLCAGFNYGAHAKEMGKAQARPTFFLRFASSLVGHDQPILRPAFSDSFDWEGEVAIVVGRGGHRIARAAAWDHVAGYCCFGDHSIREWQAHGTQATAGKNFDATGAIGPVLTLRAAVPDPAAVRLRTLVNGEQMQSATLAELVYDIPCLIEYVSTFTTLEPGDVIATGTPPGIGLRMTPPRFLQVGDTVEVIASGIGHLRNRVAAEP